MASANRTISVDNLSADTLLELLAEAEITAERAHDDLEGIQVDMNGVVFIVEPYPAQGAVKIWTAIELNPDEHGYEQALKSANAFNMTFIFVRNFVYQDPEDLKNYRAVWDHDHLVGPDGLTSAALAAVLSKVADVLSEAFSQQEPEGASC